LVRNGEHRLEASLKDRLGQYVINASCQIFVLIGNECIPGYTHYEILSTGVPKLGNSFQAGHNRHLIIKKDHIVPNGTSHGFARGHDHFYGTLAVGGGVN